MPANDQLNAIKPETDLEVELVESQRDWLAHEQKRRAKSNRRIRAVVDARDSGTSVRRAAHLMSSVGKKVTPDQIVRLTACGYPTDDLNG